MVRRLTAAAGLLLSSSATGWACAACRPQVTAGIYTADFLGRLVLLLLPVLLILLGGLGLYFADRITTTFRKE